MLSGLFVLSHVEKIEAEAFGDVSASHEAPTTLPEENRLASLEKIEAQALGDLSAPNEASTTLPAKEKPVPIEKAQAEELCENGKPAEAPTTVVEGTKPATNSWILLIQAEAARRWTTLRRSGANPTKLNILDDLARWCRENGVKTRTNINPSAEYIYRHALRTWVPPID